MVSATGFFIVDLSAPTGTTGTNAINISNATICTDNTGSAFDYRLATTGFGLFGGGSMSPTKTNQLSIDYSISSVTNGKAIFTPIAGQTAVFTQVVGNGSAGMSFKPATVESTTMRWGTPCGPGNGFTGEFKFHGAAMTLNGLGPTPIPTAAPSPTPIPTSTPVPTPVPVTGNIININFGINNLHPWIQSVCGDIRMDNGITNLQPSGQSTIITNASCTNPGVIFSGDAGSSFGQGQPSSTGWVVGGTTYPEVYSPPNTGGIFSSYSYLTGKSQTTDTPPIDLASICSLSNCTLPSTLPQGVYIANSDITLNAYTFPLNQHYVFLINGNLTIQGNILTPPSSSSVFSAYGNIILPPTVGNPVAVTTANLSGIFSTDRSFIVQSNNNCTDLRLTIEGTLIVNAGRTGGTLQNNRDLCANNATAPTIQLTQRLDFVLNLPDFIRLQRTTLEEVAP